MYGSQWFHFGEIIVAMTTLWFLEKDTEAAAAIIITEPGQNLGSNIFPSIPQNHLNTDINIIEDCDQPICEEKICNVRGSISDPRFYASCHAHHPDDMNISGVNNLDAPTSIFMSHCMCSAAYHSSVHSSHHDLHGQVYVPIKPQSNCFPDLHQRCDQRLCHGHRKKSRRLAHLCHVKDKYYCACFY